MRTMVVLVAVGCVLVGNSATAAAARSSGLTLCGQIKGPHDAWTATLRGGKNKRLQGTTWTVTALLAPCSTGMKLARAVLPQWAKAKPDAPLKASGGWKCTKVGDIGPGSVRESRGRELLHAGGRPGCGDDVRITRDRADQEGGRDRVALLADEETAVTASRFGGTFLNARAARRADAVVVIGAVRLWMGGCLAASRKCCRWLPCGSRTIRNPLRPRRGRQSTRHRRLRTPRERRRCHPRRKLRIRRPRLRLEEGRIRFAAEDLHVIASPDGRRKTEYPGAPWAYSSPRTSLSKELLSRRSARCACRGSRCAARPCRLDYRSSAGLSSRDSASGVIPEHWRRRASTVSPRRGGRSLPGAR